MTPPSLPSWTTTATLLALVTAVGLPACGGDGARPEPDLEAVRRFVHYPLYWPGERFEGMRVEHVSIARDGFSSVVYGTCEPEGPARACAPPLAVQIQPLCAQLAVVARTPTWERRRIRGAPVGTLDGAPVLFTDRVQVKVYRGGDTDPGLPARALQALRSANRVEPLLRPDEPIPAAPLDVLAGEAPCEDGTR